MATSQSDMDCTCPVCCDIFKDPVVLLCGHSFCKYCLQEWWRQSASKTCPVCKEIFPMAQPPRNLALRNLSDNLRRERSQNANSSKDMCSVHIEKLKLFCEDDQQLICVICRDAQTHKKHNCVPINEAAESRRTTIKIKLRLLESKLGSFKTEKLNCDKMAGQIQLQAQRTEKTITEEFEKLFQFLRAEKAARIDAVMKEAACKSEAMNIMIVNLTAEISSLTLKIKTIKKDMEAEDISFMLNVKSTMERSQCNLPNPETPSGVLIDEAKHVGNLLFNVWNKMKNLIQYTPITLDPNTGGSDLTISEQLTRSSNNDYNHPGDLEKVRISSILSIEGFSSGKCSWDVAVDSFWAVGVAAKTKNQVYGKIWSIFMCGCLDWLGERTPEHFMEVEHEFSFSFPTKIRVQLDYDKGILSFFDLNKETLIRTIKCAFTETVFPYFYGNTKLLPAELSVGIKLAK